MPLYDYQAKDPEQSCDFCRDGFSQLQSMKDDPLAACPRCGLPVQRLIPIVGVATPKTNSELKNLGFTKLVKRDTGVYENVTRTGSEARYMEAGKSDTVPDLKRKIRD
ncbi:zinc ribbon domain-containing protein [Candidatus Sumerlaeota bacterium]|nr:zinc ribbon domain-containing protein [Candidatus Sumerlaeota bacterium]